MKLNLPSAGELSEIQRFVSGLEGEYELHLSIIPGSSWLVFHARLWAWSGTPDTSPPRSRTFGMWRSTRDIYAEDHDGAMSADAAQEGRWPVEVMDGPEFNTRHHWHTDPKCGFRWVAPHDGMDPPAKDATDECPDCIQVVPVVYAGARWAPPDA